MIKSKVYENICRLCLEKSNKIHPVTLELCDSTIANVLKSFIPELYLGVSSSPVICTQCYKILESFQKFKQKCLETEYLIGVYLRETKCTALAIKLKDVLEFWECHKKVDEIIQKTQKEIEDEQKLGKETKATIKQLKIMKESRPVLPKQPLFTNTITADNLISMFLPNQDVNNASPLDELSLKNLLTDCPSADTRKCDQQTPPLVEPLVIKPAEKVDNIPGQLVNASEGLLGYLSSQGYNVSGPDHERFDLETKIKRYFLQSEPVKPNGSAVTENKSSETEPKNNFTFNDENLTFCTETGVFKNKDGKAFDSLGKPVDVTKPVVIPPDPKPRLVFTPKPMNIGDEPPATYIFKNNVAADVEQPPVLSPQAIIPSNNAFSFSISDVKSLQGETIESISYLPIIGTTVQEKIPSAKKSVKEKAPKRKYVIIKHQNFKNFTGFTNLTDMTSIEAPTTVDSPELPSHNLDTFLNSGSQQAGLNEDLIEIKDEPLGIDENELNLNLFPSDGETTRSASETSFYENLARESGLDNLLSIIPEGETHFDVPEYVHINNVSYEDLNKLKQESEAFTRTLSSPKNIVRNPAANTYIKSTPAGLKASKMVVKRNTKRRLRLVPVDKEPLPQVYVPTSTLSPINKRRRTTSDHDSKNNVVVLFTNFTENGDYINDHDYLINPYKRNNMVTVKYDLCDQPVNFCLCQVCGDSHPADNHLGHMKDHGSVCNVCHVDFRNVFILNLHVKMHVNDCPICYKKDLMYWQLQNHDAKHQEEMEKRKTKRESDSDEEASVYDSATNSFKTPSSIEKALLESIKTETPEVKPISRIPKRRGRPRRKFIQTKQPVTRRYKINTGVHDKPSDSISGHDKPSGSTTSDHDKPSDNTSDHDKPTCSTSDHDKPSDSIIDYGKPSDSTSDHDNPSGSTSDHDKPSGSTSDHDKPSGSTSDHDKPSGSTSDHDKPSDNTGDHDKPNNHEQPSERDKPSANTSDIGASDTKSVVEDVEKVSSHFDVLDKSGNIDTTQNVTKEETMETDSDKKAFNEEVYQSYRVLRSYLRNPAQRENSAGLLDGLP